MTTQTLPDECFAGTDKWGRFTVINLVRDGRGIYGGRTLDETRQEYPDAELMPFDAAVERAESQWIGPVQEITRARYWEMLEVLPPVRWKHFADAETFYMSEFTSGRVTEHFCRIGREDDARYFCKADRFTLKPLDLIVACRNFIAAHPARTVQE